MYPAYVLLLLLFFTVPQLVLAVKGGKQDTAKQQLAIMALRQVANNAYLNYNKNTQTMKHHSKQIAAIGKAMNEHRDASRNQIIAASMDTLVGKLPTTDSLTISRELVQWMNMRQQERQKHRDHFERASFAAGKQFRMNRLLHAAMPTEIKPAENTPKKALLFVAQNAWKKSGPDTMRLHELNKEIQTLRQCKASGKSTDQGRLTRLREQCARGYVKFYYDGSKSLFTHNVVGMTIKGVQQKKLEPTCFRAMTEWSRKNNPGSDDFL